MDKYTIPVVGGGILLLVIVLSLMGGIGAAFLVPVLVALGIALAATLWVLGRRERPHA